MGCANCGSENSDIRMPCEVCRLVNKDEAVKRVRWCDTCSAYICADHWNDITARAKALAIKSLEGFKKMLTG